MYEPQQGNLICLNFTPSFGREVREKHPPLVVSSNAYNKKRTILLSVL
ncbi:MULTISPECIES: type II toxin-antitoxin system PemK/MazF family toxin [Enterococcus]|uniref:Type II toxin-antitoxin system PemK/MazF family toxin n=1 Tax=Candidatus Enterococcus mangumiae TaxID=2230878 RepID=A0ABZ2SX63_9ENTE|nr:type II toxin-antitoxin system PemK/MazF family toxin [Enterococcus sp. DIV1298c]MBO0489657.1 type II toxin-antitoxin system PemK/MazF family toxin [Enterococcus sp. DIV1094]MBO1298474.1 type II toxin-antitoxin system PemK/MazF family toxin [Enterococcus sp. DIV1271a]